VKFGPGPAAVKFSKLVAQVSAIRAAVKFGRNKEKFGDSVYGNVLSVRKLALNCHCEVWERDLMRWSDPPPRVT
jgi:hypothetical protein